MRTSFTLPLLALGAATSIQALGIVDNLVLKTKLVAQATTFDAGEYVVRNAKTGHYFKFSRPGDTTNVHTSEEYGTVTLTHGGAKGMSGVNFGQYSGTIITGMGKCGSAQWGMEDGAGVDVALVSYACSVGEDPNGTDTLEVAKQFWRIVPCGDSASSSSSSASTADFKAAVKLNAVAKSDDSAATASFQSKDDGKTAAPSPTAAAPQDDGAWSPQTTKEVSPYDQTTWVCQHPGYWLARHPDYVWEAGHVECQDDLEDYYKSLKKRSAPSHKGMAKRLRLRARAAASGRYCIIAEDHLSDMTTRAVSDKVVSSPGGYTSQQLVNYDPTDLAQQWDIWAA